MKTNEINSISTLELARALRRAKKDSKLTQLIAYTLRCRALARCQEFQLPYPPQLSSL